MQFLFANDTSINQGGERGRYGISLEEVVKTPCFQYKAYSLDPTWK